MKKSLKNQMLIQFGLNLRKKRTEAGLTQETLAELAKCHPNYIGSIERGERNITVIKIVNIASALKCRVDDLFEGLL